MVIGKVDWMETDKKTKNEEGREETNRRIGSRVAESIQCIRCGEA
jgi:hypothetical protein